MIRCRIYETIDLAPQPDTIVALLTQTVVRIKETNSLVIWVLLAPQPEPQCGIWISGPNSTGIDLTCQNAKDQDRSRTECESCGLMALLKRYTGVSMAQVRLHHASSV